jgi:uroporphyrinogen decarboxylase
MIREKFFKAMRREEDHFIPFEFILCPSLVEQFKQTTGQVDYAEYYHFPTRTLSVEYVGSYEKFTHYFQDNKEIMIDDWGVGRKKGSLAHFMEMVAPMFNFTKMEEFERYPYPNPISDYDWDGLAAKVNLVKSKDLVAVALMEKTVFEMAWYLRGMENFMMDMVLNEEMACYHMDRITEIRCELARRYAASGCDILRLGDDVSTQLDMMMNPETWRKLLKPRLAKVIASAKNTNPKMLIFYHGDGNLQKIIPDLIEIGVEILNPIQSECMDPIEVKNKYGNKLSFWGTVGTQTTMPFGTVDQVKQVCLEMINLVGKGGGLLLAPTHVLEPEVPWENINAFINVIMDYNQKSV